MPKKKTKQKALQNDLQQEGKEFKQLMLVDNGHDGLSTLKQSQQHVPWLLIQEKKNVHCPSEQEKKIMFSQLWI